jgi:purine-binding chemotaxis protein CheW
VNRDENRLALAARTLREAFDESFAHAPKTDTSSFENFLAVRVGADPYAIRLTEITGLYCDRNVVPIISQAPHFVGIASFRGTMAPVYDLPGLLGYPDRAARRWLVLAGAHSSVGLAFDRFEAYARAPRDGVHEPGASDPARQHVRGAVQTDDAATRLRNPKSGESPTGDIARPIIHIASILEAIARLASPDSAPKER